MQLTPNPTRRYDVIVGYEPVWTGAKNGVGGAYLIATPETPVAPPALPATRQALVDRVWALLETGPLTHRQIVDRRGEPPHRVTCALGHLRASRRVRRMERRRVLTRVAGQRLRPQLYIRCDA